MAIEVSHRVDGDPAGPPLVLSGSLGTTLAMWRPQVGALGKAFRVIRYDHRGHGRSPVPGGPYEIEDLAEDAIELLDRLEVERASFCGLSLGGMVGMWLAAHRPERVDRLVVCCSSPHMPPASAWHDRAGAVREAGRTDPVADAVVARWLTPGFADRRPDLVRALREMLAATPAEGYAACCEAIAGMDLREALPLIAAPTLVIAGGEDPAAPADGHGALIAGAIPDARLEIVSPAAHLANLEQPEAVTALIAMHLERKEATL